MLTNLYIENIAVIEKTETEFDNGMCVLTGETGAGKSIIIDSINIILGARTNKALVRYGTDKASVTAVFDIDEKLIPFVEDMGIDCPDRQLIIKRDITAEGKSVCRVNSVITPLAKVRELSGQLINIHGQLDNQNLLNPSMHRDFLDKFANNDDIYSKYRICYNKLKDIKKEIDSISTDEAEKNSKIDFLTFQINEIESAKLKKGEDERLENQRLVISNAERINSAIQFAYANLYDSQEVQPAYDGISMSVSKLEEVTEYDGRIKSMYDKLSAIMYDLEDCTHEINDYARGIDYDENLLNDIEARLNTINRLKMKYGGSIENVLDFLEKSRQTLENITHSDDILKKLKDDYEKKLNETKALAKKLSETRKKAGKILSAEIEKSMHELDMKSAVFSVDISEESGLMPHGCDKVEFLISTNAGEPLKPLVKTASGGELSRVMLSIKSILADSDDVDTLIFDEIDTGVSGNAAQKIAVKLSGIAKSKQVICITHLASIAAMADAHYLIAKNESDGRTSTTLKKLDRKERVNELARIIDGADITETASKHAAEMLDIAEKSKKKK